MCIFGGDGGSKALARQQQQQADEARADATARAGRIQTGNANIDQTFGQFNDDYFNKLSKSYLDYAQPQLDDQYTNAKKYITYALARNGTTHSSIAGDEFGDLAKQYATNETGLNSTAADYANRARADVAANKSSVIGQLNASGDADAATTAALSASRVLAAPPSFSPLSALFTNVSALAAQNKLASDSNPATSSGARLYGAPSTSYGVR